MATGNFTLKQVNQAIAQGAWSGYIAPRWVEYLVVAGGGGGANGITNGNNGGGGGAGGLLTGIVTVATGTSYTVTVGAGGVTGSGGLYAGLQGANSVFGSIVSTGGGGGRSPSTPTTGGGGGSGGGGASGGSTGANSGGDGVVGQGNKGGSGTDGNTIRAAGGGGGAGTIGLNGITSSTGGNGGAGIASAITGTVVTYAGGGGGGIAFSGSSPSGVGGVGGGGGGATSATSATTGSANTGGGGGGAWGTTADTNGATGGSGIVVVRYPGNVQFYTGGTVNYSNGYIIHIFTASGTLAPTAPTVYSTSYQISRSLRFNAADSTYLTRTPASASNRTTWTWSAWVKRGSFSGVNQVLFGTLNSTSFFIYWDTVNCLSITDDSGAVIALGTTQVFRDPSAWYHVVFALDTTQATASNRVKLYINGTQVTAFQSTPLYPAQNTTFGINAATAQQIGSRGTGTNLFLDSYMTDVHFVDGQQLTPSSFGATDTTTGVWAPIQYTGTYGTNGFKLNFSDNSNTTAATLGADSSGNGNNWTPNNFSVTAGAGNDSLVDTPTPYGFDTGVGGAVRGNYATLNPLTNSSPYVLTDGNLLATRTGTAVGYNIATIAVSSGKWYFEFTHNGNGSGNSAAIQLGIISAENLPAFTTNSPANSYLYRSDGNKIINVTGSSYGASWTTNDVIGVAVNFDTSTLTFYKNGVSQGDLTTSLPSGNYLPMVAENSSVNATVSVIANFGQRPFAYTAPAGFKALCTTNLPTPAIGGSSETLASKFFNPVLYTGNGSTQSVTGVGFQPDFVWVKERSSTSGHVLFDAIRGVTKYLESNATAAEGTDASTLTAFNSDGFSVGSSGAMNQSSQTYVGWNWRAGNNAGASNSAGSITSSVSANQRSGFSIVTYTGTGANATVGHGLGVAPSMVIVKSRSNALHWVIYATAMGSPIHYLLFNTDGKGSAATVWNNTAPTSTVFSIGTDGTPNTNGATYAAYCFAPIAGYSAFGSYTGNGSADGPFVYTGFRPAFVMFKVTTVADEWRIYDEDRLGYNTVASILVPNSSIAEETTSAPVDLLSNGFKIRGTAGSNVINGSNQTYIFMAFASNPFKYSLAR